MMDFRNCSHRMKVGAISLMAGLGILAIAAIAAANETLVVNSLITPSNQTTDIFEPDTNYIPGNDSAGAANSFNLYATAPSERKGIITGRLQAMPLPFLANTGQMDERALFVARTFAGTVFITREGEIVYSLPMLTGKRNRKGDAASFQDRLGRRANHSGKRLAVKETLVGAAVGEIRGRDRIDTSYREIKGNDPSHSPSTIPAYNTVDLGEVYDRIGLTLRAYGANVEKVFNVAPGGDPGRIRLQVEGAKGLRIAESGELEIETAGGPFRLSRPVAYQEIKGRRSPVVVSYRLDDGAGASVYAFALGAYDKQRALVIDPLIASTYLGGGDNDWASAVAVGPAGEVYVAGGTQSADFPKSAGITADTGGDAFVARFDAGLTRLEAAMVFGGLGYTSGAWVTSLALKTDESSVKRVYVAGYAWSTDSPATVEAFGALQGSKDFFIACFDPALTRIETSTLVGGTYNWSSSSSGQEEYGSAWIALDAQGNIFLAGATSSIDYPTTAGAYDQQCGTNPFCNGEAEPGATYSPPDVVISKFSPDLSQLLASTFLGGSVWDSPAGISVDWETGAVYIAGVTSSLDFPTTAGGYDRTCGTDGKCNNTNVRTSGCKEKKVCAPLGDTDSCSGDKKCFRNKTTDPCQYFCCTTTTVCLPDGCGAFETMAADGACVVHGKSNGFIAKLDNNLGSLLAATYLGGSGGSSVEAMTLDGMRNIFVAGPVYSSDFPTTDGAFQMSYNGSQDSFVAKLDGNLSSLLASTYLGCGDSSLLSSGPSGTVYVGANTNNAKCKATPGAYESIPSGGFIARLDGTLSTMDAGTAFQGGYLESIIYGGQAGKERLYVAGDAQDTFPITPDAYRKLAGGSGDAFVSVLDPLLSDPGRRRFGGPLENPFTIHDGGKGPGRSGTPGLPDYWVNTANRNLVVTGTDFAYSGIGPPVALNRTWNPDPLRSGMFGNGWSFEPLWSIRYYEQDTSPYCPPPVPPDPPSDCPTTSRIMVDVTTGSGQVLAFVSEDSGTTFTPSFADIRVPLTMVKGTNTYFILKDGKSRLSFRFDCTSTYCTGSGNPAVIPLTSVTDPNGSQILYAYNADGTLQTITDAAGRATSFTYDANKRCAAMTTPDGKTLTYSYDAGGNLTQSVNLLGTATDYTYDAGYFMTSFSTTDRTTAIAYEDTSFGRRVSTVTDAGGNVTRYAADAANPKLTRITDPRGGVTEVENIDGRTTSLKDPLGNITLTVYDTLPGSGSFGLPVSVTHPNGTTTLLEYDARGNLTKQTDPAGGVTTYTYDANDNRLSMTDALGGTSRYAYDGAGNMLTSISPEGRQMSFSYDAVGNPVVMTDPNGQPSNLAYDSRGNLTGVTGPTGHTSSFGYDAAGFRMISGSDPRGGRTTLTYDAGGRVTGTDYPTGNSHAFGYDACTLNTVKDGSGILASFARDPLWNVTGISNRLGRTTTLNYDGNGNLASWADPLGRTTTRTHDGANRLTAETNPAGETGRLEYDSGGNIAAFVDKNGKRTTFTYDARGLLLSTTDPQGAQTTLTRDALGRVTSQSVAGGQAILYSYDADGLVTQKKQGDAVLSAYGYDNAGQLATVNDPEGTTTYTRDAFGRVTRIDYPGGRSVSMTYDASGNPATLIQGDGTVIFYVYDGWDRLTRISWGSQKIDIAYDGAGRLLSETRSNGTTSLYGQDENGRDSAIAHRKGATDMVRLSYSRDEAGNTVREGVSLSYPVTAPADRDTVTTFDTVNQVVKSGGDSYSYDSRGNLTGIVNGSAVKTFDASYDPENRPVSISRNGVTADYMYNGLGQRVRADRGGTTTRYCHDADGRLLFETDGSGQITSMYIYGGGRLVAMRRGGTDYFYHFDKAGSTLLITDAAGNIAATYAYLPFGEATDRTGQIPNPFTYVGAYGVMDEGDGLYFMKARYYDAKTRRFIQRDPLGLGGGENLYSYVGNNPIEKIDPLGLLMGDAQFDRLSRAMLVDPTLSNVSFLDKPIDWVTDITAGFGDALSLGVTRYLRGSGADAMVNNQGRLYNAAWWGGAAYSLATGAVQSLNAGTQTVLYSGRWLISGELAGYGAAQAGKGTGMILADTLGGRVLNLIDTRIVQLPDALWKAASGIFVANAKGNVPVFLRGSVTSSSVWGSVEKPLLKWLGNATIVFK